MTVADPDGWKTEELAALCRALLTLRTVDEMALFLRDICTRNEIGGLTGRWMVVILLETGLSYREISEQTGVSTTTIGRVNEWRLHGMGGYRLALDRMAGTPDA